MTLSSSSEPLDPIAGENLAEIDLTDDDIREAMREISGYLDITTSDFRALYHHAHRHALDRLFNGLSAARLMRCEVQPLTPETPLAEAIPSFVRQGLKVLPVAELMTSPAMSVPLNAGPREIIAFATHPGRTMPVLSADGRLAGLLARKAFLNACHLDPRP